MTGGPDQSEVVDWLEDPASHGPGVEAVARIDTHAAMVFLAGARAYKLKRAVRYPYLDFSGLAQREWACRRELALNRRTAPKLYLDVVPVVRRADGRLALGGEGEVLDWLVVMERFPQDALFDRLAKAGKLSLELCRALADEIAAFHRQSERIADAVAFGGANSLRWVIEENDAAFRGRPDLFPPEQVARAGTLAADWLARLGPLLDRRQADGYLRQCHGDLHLRNICLVEGAPVIFDCIEFNDRIARIDVLYDLAFLLMDLDEHGLPAQANTVLNRYLQHGDDYAGLAALPLFLAERAAVRAQVTATAEACHEDENQRRKLRADALRYFQAAMDYLTPPPACLVTVGGFSGTGKTSLARRLAPGLGPVPGAVHLRSDVLRKALWGRDELSRLPPEAYSEAMSDKVYEALLARAETVLTAGHGVILDAVSAKPAERLAIEALAGRLGVPFFGLWLEAPLEVLRDRVTERSGDASDATAKVVEAQMARGSDRPDWARLDAAPAIDQVAEAAHRLLAAEGLLARRGHGSVTEA